MATSVLDKDTFQLHRNIKLEAHEKAYEIEVHCLIKLNRLNVR
jgi:hypothetical protein